MNLYCNSSSYTMYLCIIMYNTYMYILYIYYMYIYIYIYIYNIVYCQFNNLSKEYVEYWRNQIHETCTMLYMLFFMHSLSHRCQKSIKYNNFTIVFGYMMIQILITHIYFYSYSITAFSYFVLQLLFTMNFSL